MNSTIDTITKASIDDAEAIYKLITYYAAKGLILERSLEDIREQIDHFWVAKRKESIWGIVSYYDYGEHLKEIRSLAVSEDARKTGIGSALLASMIAFLKGTVNPKIFVLTYSPDFFIKNGFTTVDKDSLPEKIWKDCDNCKNREHCTEVALVANV